MLMELLRPLPTPITPEAQPYWDGLKENKLMLPKCDDCGKAHFYPRVICPHCHSGRVGQKGVVTKSGTNQEIERNAGVE